MWLESPEYECYCWEVFWKEKQNISEFTGWHKEKDSKTLECDKSERAITCMFSQEFT